MSLERMTAVAIELKKLGVSQAGVLELLGRYPIELVEAQLSYLPYRKARRPEAFIIQAVRNNFSAPKELYAKTQTDPSTTINTLDEDHDYSSRPTAAEPQGLGAATSPDPNPANDRLGSGEPIGDHDLPEFEEANR